MKTTIKLFVGMMILLGSTSCEKDEFNPEIDSDAVISEQDLKTYNNGMIKSYSSDAIIKWTEALSAAIDNKKPQPFEARVYAMVTLAIHDALNNVVPKYETYALDNGEINASEVSKKNISAIADAAVAQAAYSVLSTLYPASRTAIDQLLENDLAAISDQVSKEKGISIGMEAASAILLKRQGDFIFVFSTYVGSSEPGSYRADYAPYAFPIPGVWAANSVYAANLGELTPFGIESGDQFRPMGPYSVNSSEYTSDYNEVKTLGCAGCPEKTAEQSELAAFWHESSASMLNRNTRTIAANEKLNGWETARLLALVQMSIMDSYIASFDGYFHFNFWRPITAIRNGDSDGNPETMGNTTWTPVYTTPPAPEFPSTNGYAGGATAAILQLYFKKDVAPFTIVSPIFLAGVERTMYSFGQMADETSISRVYAGHHFRNSTEVGKQKGYELGQYVFNNNLQELKHTQ